MDFHFFSQHDAVNHDSSFDGNFRMVAGGQYGTTNKIQPASGYWFEIFSFELIWDASRAGGPPGFGDAYIL